MNIIHLIIIYSPIIGIAIGILFVLYIEYFHKIKKGDKT